MKKNTYVMLLAFVLSALEFSSYAQCGDTITECYGNGGDLIGTYTADTPGNYITLSFSAGETEEGYDDLVIYEGTGTSGAELYRADGDHTGVEVTSTTGVITVYVDSDYYSSSCDTFSSFDDLNFTITCAPPPSCPSPTALSVGEITDSTAEISWTAGDSETEWEIIYGEAGFDPETEGETETDTGTAGYSLTGLGSGASYDVYVKAICSETDESSLVGPESFCTIATIPYTIDFEPATVPSLPDCTTQENVGYGNDWVTSTADYVSELGYSGAALVYVYDSYSSANVWFYTIGIQLTSGEDYQISYKYGNDGGSTYPEKLRVSYGTSPSAAAMNTELANYPSVVTEPDTYETAEVIFTVPADGIYYFGFNAYSNPDQDVLLVDDISITLAPTCLKPTDVIVNNITSSSAGISWTAGDAETEWEVIYGEAGFDPETEGEVQNVTEASSTTLTELGDATEYDVYVKAVCGEGDESEFSLVESFATECNPIAAPFTENFNDSTIPICWEQDSNNNWEFDGTISWSTSGCSESPDDHTEGDAGNFAAVDMTNTETSDSPVLMMPIIDVSSLSNPALSFYVFMCTEGYSPSNSLYVEAFVEGAWIEILMINEGSAAWENKVLSLESYVEGDNVQLRFRTQESSSSNSYYGDIAIDDIEVNEGPSCYMPFNLMVANESSSTVDLSWTAGSSETEWEIIYGLDGFNPEGEEVLTANAEESPSITLIELESDTDYQVYLRSDCGETTSDLAGPVDFTTLISCPQPTALSVGEITDSTAEISWTAGETETEWQVIYGQPDFDPETEGETANVTGGTPSVILTELSDNTEYEVYVKAVCSTDDESDLTEAISFTTELQPVSAPWTEGFATTSVPEGWDTSGWDIEATNDRIPNLEGTFISKNLYNWNDSGIFTSINITNITPGDQLSFSYLIADWDNYPAQPTANSLTLEINISTDYGENYTNISTLENDGSMQGWQEFTYDMLPYVGETVKLQIVAIQSTDDFELAFDNFEIGSGFSGYVYTSEGGWSPTTPEGNATAGDNIMIENGSTVISSALEINDVELGEDATLYIEDVMTVNGEITNNGMIVFRSTATKDGELAAFTSTVTGDGEIMVERYLSDNRSYRMLSSTVTSSGSIHAHWQEGATGATDNPSPGYGTHITGSVSGGNGFDATGSGAASMFTVDTQNQSFVPVSNTDVDNLVAGQPYFMYIRGDRTIDLTVSGDAQGSTATTLRATGDLAIGAQVQEYDNVPSGGFAMFGNPYQSSIDVTTVFGNSTNVNSSAYYIYDPTLGDYGAYTTVDLTTGDGVGTGGSSANKYLQPGQAAQVASSTAGTVTLNFAETDKSPGNHLSTNRMSADGASYINTRLFVTENYMNANAAHDGFMVRFDGGFSNTLGVDDISKPMNFSENMGIGSGNEVYSIEKRQMPVEGDIIQLYTDNYEHSDYTLVMEVNNLFGMVAYLNDTYTGEQVMLNEGGNVVPFSVDTDITESVGPDRFFISFAEDALSTKDNEVFTTVIYPNPTQDGNFVIKSSQLQGKDISLKITDMLGREVYTRSRHFAGNTLNVNTHGSLTSGMYFVSIIHQGSSIATHKLVKQ